MRGMIEKRITKQPDLSITFRIHGEKAVRNVEGFIEKVAIPLKEKYSYVEIHIEVNC